MKNDFSILKAQKESLAKRLKHLLESQIELIKVLEMDDVGFTKATVDFSNSQSDARQNNHTGKPSQ